MDIQERLYNFLNNYWNANKVQHPGHLQEGIDLYNEIYHDNPNNYGLQKRTKAKAGCTGCLTTMLNGLKNVINKKLIPGILVSGDEFAGRLDTCRNCSYFNPTATVCNECGCFLYVKATLSNYDCTHPEGSKWSKL